MSPDSYILPLQLLLTIGASFLIGLEMEGRKIGGKVFSPGGVRTFPLICLGGFLLAVLGQANLVPFVVGLGVLGLWLAVLYRAKVQSGVFGMTTEAYAVVTYVLGGLVAAQMWWLVAALTVLMVLLQELKESLERLAGRVPQDEVVTFIKFALLAAVILPLVPETPFDVPYLAVVLNPRKIWLIVVAVAGVSYASYLLARLTHRSRYGMLLTGLLGGGYSSTVTTVVLARRAGAADGAMSPAELAGGVLSASGVMNLRFLVLIALFGPGLAPHVLWPLLISAAVGTIGGVLISLLGGRPAEPQTVPPPPAPTAPEYVGESGPQALPNGHGVMTHKSSPLELRTAVTFAAIFVIMLTATAAANRWLGHTGLIWLAGISGVADVDPFVLGLTQTLTSPAAMGVATLAVMIAASANNVVKGFYALALARRRGGGICLALLAGLAVVTMAAWWLMVHSGAIPPAW